MKFNSQIYTSNRSVRAIACFGIEEGNGGLHLVLKVKNLSKDNPIQWHLLPEYIDKYDEKHIPAWSLHRLIEMLPPKI